ncbi:hypothetical protein [Paenibacillus donghaensis]|uniref:Single-stranded DNA-binding protein n=1 Tax=Paenibacillus donghaensis TaxID=414771 RepID=A0A2Z2K7Z3_9BACL|nr:hypothetical protein [Paenibacillus donghaensis]ASA22686.1 hypothetical protein B9T62_18945 [Paenibacillus donghaensis]
MANEKTLQEGINTIHIEGIVKDIRIEEKPINGQDAISGEIDIQVSPESIHTVNVFSFKMNQKKEVSGLFKTLVTIRDEYKTIDVHGIENADKVRIETSGKFDNGKVGKNEYVGQDGEWRSYPKLSAKFVNRIKSDEVFEPQAKFNLELAIAGSKAETRNGEETGRLILKGFIVNYQEQKDDAKKIFPFDFVVQNPTSVNYVQDTYEKGQTVKVYGDIVNTKIVTKRLVEVGFGDPQEEIDRKEVREYIIVGGTPPYDEDDKNAYDIVLIREALKKRDVAIEKKKEEKKNGNAGSSNNAGFGSNSHVVNPKEDPFAPDAHKKENPFNNGKPLDISDEDLPF